MKFCNNYLNHKLEFLSIYNSNCIFYKCLNCDIVLNYMINSVDDMNWESVESLYGAWQVDLFQDELLTCEEEQIKKLLE